MPLERNCPTVGRNEYEVEWVPIDSIKPSPENDEIYDAVELDGPMQSLIDSIERLGLEEPIIISADSYIVSGHRRYFACNELCMDEVPVRRKSIRREGSEDWPRVLTEYNPQRIKKASSLLKEAMLRFADKPATAALRNFEEAATTVSAEFLAVKGAKTIPQVSEKKLEFLEAAKSIIDELRPFWPLSCRQIHYQLLNDPPLTSTPKRSKYPKEHYRYRNDQRSYDALIELLRQARYGGHVSMNCIDDPTRPCFPMDAEGFTGAEEFIRQEVNGFLSGYHLNRQIDQPRHIEVLGEKNTLLEILKPVCREYYVSLSLGRGYGSIPTWRNMADRFELSGKSRMTLIVASDFDPEGFDLADDAVRSLRDLFDIPVEYQRVAVNSDQIESLSLASDFNPAKETSSRLKSFVERTGGTKTWELEALPPQYLQDQVRAAIESNMDLERFYAAIDQEREDAEYLKRVRKEIAEDLRV